ncbi:hypothetical protein Anapl_18581 [Anas platyrhynchos]|uniref:Uncharacterized protein n=1 Tax=Anas platyrhynchos TaxID=8839 RepID=R0KNX1_ANAPL|nr:hypothetical protein Anapl_18581 [Anas platyrhynchos]
MPGTSVTAALPADTNIECHNTCLLLFLNVVQPASLSGISSAAVLKDTATPVSGSKLLLLLDLISRLVASGILDVNHLVGKLSAFEDMLVQMCSLLTYLDAFYELIDKDNGNSSVRSDATIHIESLFELEELESTNL